MKSKRLNVGLVELRIRGVGCLAYPCDKLLIPVVVLRSEVTPQSLSIRSIWTNSRFGQVNCNRVAIPIYGFAVKGQLRGAHLR